MTIKDELKQYPCYIFRHKKLIPVKAPDTWGSMYQMHHFIRKSIKKTNAKFYERIEHLQKLILLPSDVHYNLHSMGEVKFFEKYGVDKNLLVFNRYKWREGFYEDHRETKTDN